MHSCDSGGALAGSRKILGCLIATIAVIALIGGVFRERMYYVGPGLFWEPELRHRIDHGYFSGLQVGNRLASALDGIEAVKAENERARIFFGPRIEFGYAVTQSRSPHGLPLWWHPGTSYAVSDEGRILKAFARNRFDTLVFLRADRTRMPAALLAFIEERYVQVPGPEGLDVFHPRPRS